MKKTKPRKKPRRVVLGVGHPWYNGDRTSIALTEGHHVWNYKIFAIKNTGNWNKVRLVLEVLK